MPSDEIGPQKMLALIAASAAILAADPTATLGAFSFPSAQSRSLSPSGSLLVKYTDPGPNADGIHEYDFTVASQGGRKIGGFTFTRMVQGAWSPSDALYVNNYIGSNMTDCLTTTASKYASHLSSVTKAIRKNIRRGHATIQNKSLKRALNSEHSYVTCSSWLGKNTVKISIKAIDDSGKNYSEEMDFCVLNQEINRRCD